MRTLSSSLWGEALVAHVALAGAMIGVGLLACWITARQTSGLASIDPTGGR